MTSSSYTARAALFGWVSGITMNVAGFFWLGGMLKTFSGFPLPICLVLLLLVCAYQGGRIGLLGWLYERDRPLHNIPALKNASERAYDGLQGLDLNQYINAAGQPLKQSIQMSVRGVLAAAM